MDPVKVFYRKWRWELLRSMRAKCLDIMKLLRQHNIYPITHGSIARGDVTSRSDVDLFVPEISRPHFIELALQERGFQARYIVQATPHYAVKGYIEVDDQTTVSFPLSKFSLTEMDFYKFGGLLTWENLKVGRRVPGVDKRLMLITPTQFGHIETSIVGQEGYVAKLLGVSPAIVKERVRTLLRRRRIGRTGVFIKRKLSPDESFGDVLKKLMKEKPFLKKRIFL
jgi:hypothetical protein